MKIEIIKGEVKAKGSIPTVVLATIAGVIHRRTFPPSMTLLGIAAYLPEAHLWPIVAPAKDPK